MKLDSDATAREIGDTIDPLNGERLERLGITRRKSGWTKA